LKEEHRARPADREIADLIDEEERRKDERLHPVQQAAGKLRLLERGDEIT
jgi:hypothetical protein